MKMKIQSMQSLKKEMMAVARDGRKAAVDAAQLLLFIGQAREVRHTIQHHTLDVFLDEQIAQRPGGSLQAFQQNLRRREVQMQQTLLLPGAQIPT